MNPYDFYITPEEYEVADANGISAMLLNRRIRKFAWDKRRAMMEPPREIKDRKELLQIASSNGVGRVTFQTRISRGWDEERAAMTPPFSKAERVKQLRQMADKNRIIPLETKAIAERNGIPYKVLSWRILRAGWDHQRAATEPVWSVDQRARYSVERYREIYGHKFGEYALLRG